MVKAIDLKSISILERRFEPYHLRYKVYVLLFQYEYTNKFRTSLIMSVLLFFVIPYDFKVLV